MDDHQQFRQIFAGVFNVFSDDTAQSTTKDTAQNTAKDAIQADGHAYIVESELGRDVREDLARYVVTSDWGLLHMHPVAITLEDVFLRLTETEEEVAP